MITLKICENQYVKLGEYNTNWCNNTNLTNKIQCCGIESMQCDARIRTWTKKSEKTMPLNFQLLSFISKPSTKNFGVQNIS